MKRSVVIIGAGITGLALGWFLKNYHGDSLDIAILEKESRTGGWIKTIQAEGFMFDTGPRSCRTRGAGIETLKLIESLHLQNEVVACAQEAQCRYLYKDQKLQKLPNSILGAFFSPLTRPYVPLIWKEWTTTSQATYDESIFEFISRRFSTAFAEELFDPLTLGIYAGDIKKLSMTSCFPEFAYWEKQHHSIVKGLLHTKKPDLSYSSDFIKKMCSTPIFTFKHGMETLTKALTKTLSTSLYLENPALNITVDSSKVKVTTPTKDFICDHVYFATPPYAIAHAVESLSPFLKDFSSETVTSVHLGWNSKVLPKEGFGYLIPSKEKEPLLGVIFDSSAFPQQNKDLQQTRITAMMRGREENSIEVTKKALYKHLGINVPPDFTYVSHAFQAIPQYTVGHNRRLAELKDHLNKIFKGKATLLGSSWHGVAVNDCIKDALLISKSPI